LVVLYVSNAFRIDGRTTGVIAADVNFSAGTMMISAVGLGRSRKSETSGQKGGSEEEEFFHFLVYLGLTGAGGCDVGNRK
jgi:hypothetical protein